MVCLITISTKDFEYLREGFVDNFDSHDLFISALYETFRARTVHRQAVTQATEGSN